MISEVWIAMSPDQNTHNDKTKTDSRGNSPVDSLIANSELRVRLVRTTEQMNRVVAFRRRAYARFPSQDALMSRVEDGDLDSSAVLVVAENVSSGIVLGTMRVHCGSDYVLRRFPDLPLSAEFASKRLSFVTRLAVEAADPSTHAFVRSLLFKSCYQVCVASQASEMLVVVHPRRTWQFRLLSFEPLHDKKEPVRLAALGYEPLVAMSAHVPSIGRRLRELNTPLHEFIFSSFHPEIEVFQSISSVESRRESATRSRTAIPAVIPRALATQSS